MQYAELPYNIDTVPSDSDDSDDFEDSPVRISHRSDFRQRLACLVGKFNLTTNVTEAILSLLREFEVANLPKTYRALMGTPSGPLDISLKAGGSYYHVGIETVLKELTALELLSGKNTLNLTCHVDGISLTGSSTLKSWPILGLFHDLPANIRPFLIGFYVGYVDPNDIDAFLERLVSDLIIGKTEGFRVTENGTIFIDKIRFLCDAMARLKLTHTYGPTGLNGCYMCSQVGEKINGTVQYKPHIVYPLRTNKSYRDRRDKEHHHPEYRDGKRSILENPILGLDMIKSIPPDALHQCDLGSTKIILESILINRLNGKMDIPEEIILKINQSYINLADFAPIEFQRTPRDLIGNFPYLKATEFKNLALYYCIVILRDLSDEQYEHFLFYCLALRLLADSDASVAERDSADSMMQHFVAQFDKFYPDCLVFNIHMMLHLRAAVDFHGCLYDIAGYPFENTLRIVKGDVRKPTSATRQMANRHAERGILQFKKVLQTGLSRKCQTDEGDIFLQYTYNSITFRSDAANSFAAIRDENGRLVPVKILHFKIINDHIVAVYSTLVLSNIPYFSFKFEDVIYTSDMFAISVSTGTNNQKLQTDVSNIALKYVALPDSLKRILIPFLHNIVSFPKMISKNFNPNSFLLQFLKTNFGI